MACIQTKTLPVPILAAAVWAFGAICAAAVTPTQTYAPLASATPTLMPTPTICIPVTDGSNDVLMCRGGTHQGECCAVDSDCGDGAVCVRLGHQRSCANHPRCLLGDTLCSSNVDCPQWHKNGDADTCSAHGQFAYWACTSDTDCGLCGAGSAHAGLACRRALGNTDCGGGATRCDPAGPGACINGISGCQLGYPWITEGIRGDTVADQVWMNRTLETDNDHTNTVDSVGGSQFKSVGFDTTNQIFYGGMNARVGMWLGAYLFNGAPADGYYGQSDSMDSEINRIPGDASWSSAVTPVTLWDTFGPAVKHAIGPDPDGAHVWIADGKTVKRIPAGASYDAVADWWYGADLTGVNPSDITQALGCSSGMALQKRCNAESSNAGVPCTDDDGCTGGGSCVTDMAIADYCYNRVVVVDGTGTSGAAFTYFLGQPNGISTNCTVASATSLCRPGAVAFDNRGDLLVADTADNRVLRYPHDFTTGSAADYVWGQGASGTSFTTSGSGTCQSCLNDPFGVAYDSDTDSILIADGGNNRVVSAVATGDASFTGIVGQTNYASSGAGISSDGTHCDKLTFPFDVAVQHTNGTSSLWVADYFNVRFLHFSLPLPMSGSLTAANAELGQPNCTTSHWGSTDKWRIQGIGGAVGGLALARTDQEVVADTRNNRLVGKNAATGGDLSSWPHGRVPFDLLVGQTTFKGYLANPSGPSASTLNSPRLISSFGTATLGVADYGNNRGLEYALPLNPYPTPNIATRVFGQPDFATTTCAPPSASSLCGPTDFEYDDSGNEWIVSYGEGVVKMYCHAAGSLPVCTAENSGDTVADVVLGAASFNAGFSASRCGHPAADTLCYPHTVLPDIAHGRVFVSDWQDTSRCDGGTNIGMMCSTDATCPGSRCSDAGMRVLEYDAPFTSAVGMAASHVYGIPAAYYNPAVAFTTYDGARHGSCRGGPNAGALCLTMDDTMTTNGGQQFCSSGTTRDAPCATNADCPAGVCGCPGGYCDWSRSWGWVSQMKINSKGWLYIGVGGSWFEVQPPFSNGMSASRSSINTPHTFHEGTGFTACQPNYAGGGLAIDVADNVFEVLGEDMENASGVFEFFNPSDLPTAVATPPQTPTAIGTETLTVTPTYTPTPPPTGTPTATASPVTPPPMPTSTWTRTASVTPTATSTYVPTPTGTPTTSATITPSVTATVPPGSARLSGDISADDTTIPVDSVSQFPDSGTIQIDDEVMTYSGKSSPTPNASGAGGLPDAGALLKVTRGENGTTPVRHNAGTDIVLVSACVGNCNDDAVVTVDEIVSMVDIALGNAPLLTCEAADSNHDGAVTVDEVLTAVNNALNGCQSAGTFASR